MCTGRSAFEAQKRNYRRQVAQQRVEQTSETNIYNMKADQAEIDQSENLLAFTRKTGAIQRNFGLEIDRFMKGKEQMYVKLAQSKATVNEGNTARGAGRNTALAAMFQEAGMMANLRRADVQQTEAMRGASRELLSANARAIGRRGFAPVPKVGPAKPVGPSFLEQGIGMVTTATNLASGIGGGYTALTGNPLFT